MWPGAKLLVHTFPKHCISTWPRTGQSPPTRDPGPRQPKGGQQALLSQEICKLQRELEVYIHKVEELARRGNLHIINASAGFAVVYVSNLVWKS